MRPPQPAAIPLADCADRALAKLAGMTGSAEIAALDGATLLGERAALVRMTVPGRVAAGGGCRLLDAVGDIVALNLARPADRELLPALFEDEALDPRDDDAIAACSARSDAAALVARGRSMGLAMASVNERRPASPSSPRTEIATRARATAPPRPCPRVLDLSALWAGPLAAHLLWLAGCEVIKVESRTRPDAMREGQPAFHALLNQGKASVALAFHDGEDRRALLALIREADIVIEAARPRALQQLDIDADRIVRETPGLVWLTITGHGAQGDAAGWVGFGDDCGVAGGLSAALFAATGRTGFVGDAIADPLTGIQAALYGWILWSARRGVRFGVAMADVAADALESARAAHSSRLQGELVAWAAGAGHPFPTVRRRHAIQARPFGADAPRWSAQPC